MRMLDKACRINRVVCGMQNTLLMVAHLTRTNKPIHMAGSRHRNHNINVCTKECLHYSAITFNLICIVRKLCSLPCYALRTAFKAAKRRCRYRLFFFVNVFLCAYVCVYLVYKLRCCQQRINATYSFPFIKTTQQQQQQQQHHAVHTR